MIDMKGSTMQAIRKETVILASGLKANIAVVHAERFQVEPFNDSPPGEAVASIEAALASARLGAPTYQVPPPERRIEDKSVVELQGKKMELWAARSAAMARQYKNAGASACELWSDRRSSTPSKYPIPLAYTDYMRLRSASLARDEIFSNANYFLFEPRELDTHFEAYGDPVGMVATAGVIQYPPQVPRACLVFDGKASAIRNLCFTDVAVTLPDGTVLLSHASGAFQEKSAEPVAIARYYGTIDGLTPRAESAVEVAVVGRFAVAMSRGGGMPVPRTGCVLRFSDEPERGLLEALRQGQPVSYSIRNGTVVEGVQAGPRLVRDGVAFSDDAVFEKEGVFIEGASGDLTQPSPYNWKADWHETRAARLGAGIDANGDLFLLAVEGKSTYAARDVIAQGATLFDIAELLQRYGAIEGMHLDGGGSVQLFRPFGGAILRPGNFCRGYEDVEADYDRPVPLGLRLKLRKAG
jgi:hypothetical protein